MDNCTTHTPSMEDTLFAVDLCANMCRYFSSEKERTTVFKELLEKFLKLQVHIHQIVSNEGGECDVLIGVNGEGIGEVKTEIGQGIS